MASASQLELQDPEAEAAAIFVEALPELAGR